MHYKNLKKKQVEVLFGFMKEDDVLAYPTLISNENFGLISKPTAIAVCKSLKSKGILKTKKLNVRRHRPTDHYYLDKNMSTFLKIMALLGLHQSTAFHRKFILQRYVQRQIDIHLVKAILEDTKQRSLPQADEIIRQSEYELPILALIKTSTSALIEFLFGNWKPYVDGSQPLRKYSLDLHTGRTIYHRHTASIDHLVFKLVFLTISDLINYGKVLARDSIVEMAFIGGGRERGTKKTAPILSMKLKNKVLIDFYGGTDTAHWETTNVPTKADYWLDTNINVEDGKGFDNLDIDSSEWREKVPTEVGFPVLFFYDKRYAKLVSSRGGVKVSLG